MHCQCVAHTARASNTTPQQKKRTPPHMHAHANCGHGCVWTHTRATVRAAAPCRARARAALNTHLFCTSPLVVCQGGAVVTSARLGESPRCLRVRMKTMGNSTVALSFCALALARRKTLEHARGGGGAVCARNKREKKRRCSALPLPQHKVFDSSATCVSAKRSLRSSRAERSTYPRM